MAVAVDNHHHQSTKQGEFPPLFSRIGSTALIVGVVGIVLLVLAFFVSGSKQFMQAYLYAWVFWLTLTMGCTGLLILLNIVRASWGIPVIRMFEAGAKLLPLMGVLYLPVILGQKLVYPWADPVRVQNDHALTFRQGWMNPLFIDIRTALYFLTWSFLAYTLSNWALRQDRTGNPKLIQMRVNVASFGFLFFVITATLALTDWVMSLDAHWYSTIYGFWMLDMSGLSAMAFVSIIISWMRYTNRVPYQAIAGKDGNPLSRDLGNLLLMFTMIWGYFSLSQFLIQWSGNLPEEVTYYVQRGSGALKFITGFLLLSSFVLPFLLLLSGRNKRAPIQLLPIALFIFCVRIVDIFWVVTPAYGDLHTGLSVHWSHIAALIGIGGLWLFAFFTMLKRNPLFPEPGTAAMAPTGGHHG